LCQLLTASLQADNISEDCEMFYLVRQNDYLHQNNTVTKTNNIMQLPTGTQAHNTSYAIK